MTMRMAKRLFPVTLGLFLASSYVGCGIEDFDSQQQALLETKAATITQTDIEAQINVVKLRDCKFGISMGTGTFTPSNALSQVLYGDPDGSKHKATFPVPPFSSGANKVEITTFNADMANTGLSLSGATATMKVAFNGMLKVVVEVPFLGKLPADIQLNASSLSVGLSFDATAQRIRVASVKSAISHTTRNCGGSGWCNGLVDSVLKANLAKWIEPPLKDAITKAVDSAERTTDLEGALGFLYNLKDPKPTKWTTKAGSVTLLTNQFNFTASRP